MNEHELRSALQDVMVASSPPPSMDPRAALDVARRAQRRRHATWGGAVAGLAVVGIAVGAVMLPNPGGGGGLRVDAASSAPASVPSGAPAAEPSVGPTVTASPPAGGSATKTPWPDGQSDRTATSGPRADKANALLRDLASSLPAGLRAEDRTRIGFPDHGPMTRTQANFNEYVGELQVWEYTAYTPVVRSGEPGVGQLSVQVETKGGTRLGDSEACEAATMHPYPVDGRSCEVVDVGGKRVGVVTGDPADPMRNTVDSAAFYRYPDGTVVIVAQAREYGESGHPALSTPPLTGQQLAAIAADPKFHLE